MNKVLRLSVLAALFLSLITFGVISAQDETTGIDAAVSYTSGFQVQNLESAAAAVTLEFYRQDGTLAVTPAPSYTIAGNSSKTFFPISDVSSGFNGSLVITSDKDIRAINNLMGSGPGNYFASSNGFQAGASPVNLPLVMCNNSGFNTFFNVQNAGSGDATVTVEYIPGSNGTARSETATIKPGAAKTFNQAVGSSTVNCATLADGSGKFIGAARVTSTTQPVAATAVAINTTNFKVLMAYGGFTQGSPTIALPLVMANNSNFYSAIQVQNAGGSNTTVTVSYSANTVPGGSNPVNESFSLAPGAAKTIIHNGAPPGNGSANNWSTLGKYIGSATISNTGSQPLVAIVNQQRAVGTAMGATYEGFNPSAATSKASAPLIMANNSTYYTGIQVQNVSAGPVTVTVKYGPNTAGAFAPADEVFPLAAGASKTIIQNGAPPSNGSSVNNWGSNKYIGSATITATGGNIAAIVNQQSLSVAGDQFASGDAFNY